MIPLRDDIPSRGRPRVVRALILLNAVAFLAQLVVGPWMVEHLALRPALLLAWWHDEPLRVLHDVVTAGGGRRQVVDAFLPSFLEGALPLLTSQFLHGNLLHLGSNLLFLWIFADNIEGEVGSGPFLLYYLACGILAGIAHTVAEPDSMVPTIGASGAIAGVLGGYFLRFPHARVLTVVPIFIIPFLIEVPAVIFLGLWFVLQLIQGVTGTGGHLAVWAHAGGFVAGLLLVGVFPRVRRRPGPRYPLPRGVRG